MKPLTKRWVEFAKRDLKDAEILFDKKSHQNASWHCHQCIEKILKGIIVEKGDRLIKIHDLIELKERARVELPEDLLSFAEELNLHYLPSRYPDFYEQMKKIYSLRNVRKVIKLTKILFLWLRNSIDQK